MKVKNFNKHQHFKDRRPPWIKLYRDILEQRDINMISDKAFRVLIYLWLVASEDDEMQGNLPPIDDISFRTRVEKSVLIKCLEELKPFIDTDDIITISERYQEAIPETEKRQSKSRDKEEVLVCPDLVSEDVWLAFRKHRKIKKAPITDLVLEGFKREASIAGFTLEQAFKKTIERNWTGFEADWVKPNGNMATNRNGIQTGTRKSTGSMAEERAKAGI